MEKPCKQYISIEYYDYSEVIDYIEKKYKIEVRNYHRYYKGNQECHSYLDFWHWLLDYFGNNVSDDCYKTVYIAESLDNRDENDEDDWAYEILALIYDEFQDDEMCFHIEW